jgi:hypothetical protein
MLASIGIQKGMPFDPDEHLRNILIYAAAVANATARARTSDVFKASLQQLVWATISTRAGTGSGFFGDNYQVLFDRGLGRSAQPRRTHGLLLPGDG